MQFKIGDRRIRTIIFTAMLTSAVTVALATPAAAAPPPPSAVGSITIERSGGEYLHSTLTLKFAKPVTTAEADSVRQRLTAAQPLQAQTFAPAHLYCQQSLDRSDVNGFLTLQYQCFPTYAVTNWGYRISPVDEATVAGAIREYGWTWFRNGVRQPLGAPHTVGRGYLYHGTMKPCYNGDTLTYQDYFTWASNVYPGSTASLAIAGTLHVG